MKQITPSRLFQKRKEISLGIAALTLISSFCSLIANAEVVPGKGTLTITGQIGAGQKNIFTLRKCQFSQYYIQERVSCEKMPFPLKINEPVLLDAGIYSVHGPHNSVTGSQSLGIRVTDGQQVQVPLRTLPIPLTKGVKFRLFADITNGNEYHKMALGVWSSQANAAFLNMSCGQGDAFSQYVCGTWQSPDTLYGSMIQIDAAANYYFINQNALAEAGSGFRMTNLGRIYVNDVADTGTSVGVFPGVYGVQYIYSNGATSDQLGIVVN